MMPAWTVDRDALAELAEAIGIEKPVRVTVEPLPSWTNGRQGSEPTHHRIMLADRLDAAQAQRTLAHELFHCHQREQYDNPFEATQSYWAAHDRYGYDSNPFEVSANEFAADIERIGYQLIEQADDLAVAA